MLKLSHICDFLSIKNRNVPKITTVSDKKARIKMSDDYAINEQEELSWHSDPPAIQKNKRTITARRHTFHIFSI
jgi:hypothetical protein